MPVRVHLSRDGRNRQPRAHQPSQFRLSCRAQVPMLNPHAVNTRTRQNDSPNRRHRYQHPDRSVHLHQHRRKRSQQRHHNSNRYPHPDAPPPSHPTSCTTKSPHIQAATRTTHHQGNPAAPWTRPSRLMSVTATPTGRSVSPSSQLVPPGVDAAHPVAPSIPRTGSADVVGLTDSTQVKLSAENGHFSDAKTGPRRVGRRTPHRATRCLSSTSTTGHGYVRPRMGPMR
jgi:hypothetical protein